MYLLAVLKRYLVTSALVCVTLITLVYATLFVVFYSSQFQLWLERELSIATGYQIAFRDIKLGFPFRIIGTALTIGKSDHVVATAAVIAMSLNPLDLLYKKIQRVTIERSVIHLELDEILKTPTQAFPPLRIGHLEIRDGALILNTPDRTGVEFSSINLGAENLTLGQLSGISLNADVPWLKAKAELSFTREKDETRANLVLREDASDRLFSLIGPDKTAKEMLHLHAKLTTTPNEKANLTVSAKFDHLKIGLKPLTGVLDARVIPNTDFTQATVTANFEIAHFHKIVTEVDDGNEGAAVATLIGSYSAGDKHFSVTALKISTPLGTAHAQGSLSTDSDFFLNSARV